MPEREPTTKAYDDAERELRRLEREFVDVFLNHSPEDFRDGLRAWQERYMHAARTAAQAMQLPMLELLYEGMRKDLNDQRKRQDKIGERQGVYAGKLATLEAKMDRVFAALEFTEPHD
jgi:hypothetical protein